MLINVHCIHAQQTLSDTTIFIKTKHFQGVIFNLNAVNDFYPSIGDIRNAEDYLGVFMEKQRRKRVLFRQGGPCPYIHRNLRKYKRQYVGIFDKKGRKVIWIRAFLDTEAYDFPNWKSQIIAHADGCSHFWSIKVNLKRGKCFDYQINP